VIEEVAGPGIQRFDGGQVFRALKGARVLTQSGINSGSQALKGFKNEIARTQGLVVRSGKSVRRFARKLDNRQEEQGSRPDTVP